jgi:DNA-binding NarL/FixJ family response regulator
MSIRVAILDDKQDVREGFSFLLNHTPGLICVAACSSPADALSCLPTLKPDVILLDIDLSADISGLDCIQPLKNALPSVEIIMLTVLEDTKSVFTAIERGATGYLRKSISAVRLHEAIQDVLHGGSPISPEIARRVLLVHQNPAPESAEFAKLSEREREVIDLLARGYEPKEIADKFSITYDTVKCHCRTIYQKLQVNSKNQAVQKVFPQKKHRALLRSVSDGNVF